MDPIQLSFIAAAGLFAGLGLLARGFAGYRDAARIGDTATSRIATMAVGEVRVSGIVEPAEMTLRSAVQSESCIYYRSSISRRSNDGDDEVLDEERAVGFRVRDASGTVRVFPRGARWDVPVQFEESSGAFGDVPSGVRLRGSAPAIAPAELSREEQIAALLTIRPATLAADADGLGLSVGSFAAGRSASLRYREARIEPGDVVTVIGRVLPFDQLPDPIQADLGGVSGASILQDPEVAADLAEAIETGTLAPSPEAAWGNAAIPGFGIGRPVRAPDVDPAATFPALATAAEAGRAERTFTIAPHDLVIAAAPDAPLLIAAGPPHEASSRHEDRFLVGLLGAVLAVGSAVALAIAWSGAMPT